jgi:hypothetical protein
MRKILTLVAMLALLLLGAAAQAVTDSFTITVVQPGAPALVQHVASSSNPIGFSPSGNNFAFHMPNNVGAGNCLILGIAYPHGATPTVSDNNGNTWPASPAVTADSGSQVAAIFVLPNANAGATTITVGLGGSYNDFQYTASEFRNIATVTPVNGTSSAAAVTGPSLSTGSFTPTTNNNANGGNLIWSYFAFGTSRTNPTSWVPGGSFSLLDGDIAWLGSNGDPHASQYFVQSSQAAINPSITATGSNATFNGVSVALKAAAAGTGAPAGIHINKVITATSSSVTSSLTLHAPATGNLRVFTTAFPTAFDTISSVTDSEGNTDWQILNPGGQGQVIYSANHSANPNLTVTIHFSGSVYPSPTFVFYDIAGAVASPAGNSTGTQVSAPNSTTANNAPTFTPADTTGVAFAWIASFSSGPGGIPTGLAAGAPAGAVYDSVNYTGINNTDLMNNGDGYAHAYFSSTATQNWNWTVLSDPTLSIGATVVEFHQ